MVPNVRKADQGPVIFNASAHEYIHFYEHESGTHTTAAKVSSQTLSQLARVIMPLSHISRSTKSPSLAIVKETVRLGEASQHHTSLSLSFILGLINTNSWFGKGG